MPFLIYTSPQDKPQHFVSLCTFSCFCKLSEGPAMAMSAGTSAGGLCLSGFSFFLQTENIFVGLSFLFPCYNSEEVLWLGFGCVCT